MLVTSVYFLSCFISAFTLYDFSTKCVFPSPGIFKAMHYVYDKNLKKSGYETSQSTWTG